MVLGEFVRERVEEGVLGDFIRERMEEWIWLQCHWQPPSQPADTSFLHCVDFVLARLTKTESLTLSDLIDWDRYLGENLGETNLDISRLKAETSPVVPKQIPTQPFISSCQHAKLTSFKKVVLSLPE